MNKKTVLWAVLCASLTACASVDTGDAPRMAEHTEHCQPITEAEVAALFDRWNDSLQTGSPQAVVANYAEPSILLPTLDRIALTPQEKTAYFQHFLQSLPSGSIDTRQIQIGCNMAMDSGLYTFALRKTGAQVQGRYTYTYKWDGQNWLITSHHSSVVPGH